VALTELREVGLPREVSKTQLATLLAMKYPDHKWDRVYLLKGRFAQQKRLERALSSFFPVSTSSSRFVFFSFLLFIYIYFSEGSANGD